MKRFDENNIQYYRSTLRSVFKKICYLRRKYSNVNHLIVAKKGILQFIRRDNEHQSIYYLSNRIISSLSRSNREETRTLLAILLSNFQTIEKMSYHFSFLEDDFLNAFLKLEIKEENMDYYLLFIKILNTFHSIEYMVNFSVKNPISICLIEKMIQYPCVCREGFYLYLNYLSHCKNGEILSEIFNEIHQNGDKIEKIIWNISDSPSNEEKEKQKLSTILSLKIIESIN